MSITHTGRGARQQAKSAPFVSGQLPDYMAHCAPIFTGQGEYANAIDLDRPVILDIGANVGAFALWAAQRWPGARLHCYEPVPEHALFLAHTIRTHQLSAGFRLRAVTTAAAKTVRIFPGRTNTGAASMYDLGEQDTSRAITAKTLHPAQLPPCDVLKIDTEGCELDILTWYLPKHQPALVLLEYHRDADLPGIATQLRLGGYQVRRHTVLAPHRGIIVAARGTTIDPEFVFIATPNYEGKLCATYVHSVAQFRAHAQAHGWHTIWSTPSGEAVARARNRLVADFIESSCSRLLFWDADIGATPEHALAIATSPHDVVGGVYPIKSYDWSRLSTPDSGLWTPDSLLRYCLTPLPGRHKSSHGCLPVAEIGTGLLAVSRAAILQLIARHPELAYADDFADTRGRITHALFDYGVHGPALGETERQRVEPLRHSAIDAQLLPSAALLQRRYLSEDYLFCARWRAAGGTVLAYPCPLTHQGVHVFAGDFARRCHPVNQPQEV